MDLSQPLYAPSLKASYSHASHAIQSPRMALHSIRRLTSPALHSAHPYPEYISLPTAPAGGDLRGTCDSVRGAAPKDSSYSELQKKTDHFTRRATRRVTLITNPLLSTFHYSVNSYPNASFSTPISGNARRTGYLTPGARGVNLGNMLSVKKSRRAISKKVGVSPSTVT